MNRKVLADFESIYGALTRVNKDVYSNTQWYIRFFTSREEYEFIKTLLPSGTTLLQYSDKIYYIVVEL